MPAPSPTRRGISGRRGVAIVAVAALAGCASPAYYLQAVGGQIELWREARPIEQVRADAATRPDLRDKLDIALRIRDFASADLGLPANGSYRSYADVKRPYAVWTVFAAEAFSVEPKEWCFPVAGCVGYRGYFAMDDAEAYARTLRRDGYDVHVGGVAAYSTLGWFDDPLLNTFIHYPETELARLVFHEMAHQIAYVKDDSVFNESFATAVETAGVERWLTRHGTPAQRAAFEQAQSRRQDFHDLVLRYREQLKAVYGSGRRPQEMARLKTQILGELQEEYRALRNGPWNGFAGYDRWFGQEINNATLASVGIYTELVPAFEALLARNAGDLPRFYDEVKRLAALPKENRQARLARVLADATQSAALRAR